MVSRRRPQGSRAQLLANDTWQVQGPVLRALRIYRDRNMRTLLLPEICTDKDIASKYTTNILQIAQE